MQILSSSSFVLVSCAPTIPESAASLFVSHLLFCDGRTEEEQADGRKGMEGRSPLNLTPSLPLRLRLLQNPFFVSCSALSLASMVFPVHAILKETEQSGHAPCHEASGNCPA